MLICWFLFVVECVGCWGCVFGIWLGFGWCGKKSVDFEVDFNFIVGLLFL